MKIGNLLSTKLWFALACIWVPVSSSGAQNGTGAVWERKPSAGNLGDGNPHLQLVGHIQAAEASCPDASRQSSAALRVQGGPSQLLTSSLSCHFLPKEAIAPLRQLVRGQGAPLSSATWDEASSFRWLLNTPSSPANISKLLALTSWRQAAALEFLVTCPLPANVGDRQPIIISAPLQNSTQGTQLVVLPEVELRVVTILSAQPLVGPPAGNTLIHIQGQGLTERLTCTFANSSYAVTVNATVESPTRAHCATPAWRIATGEGWAAVRLGVLAGRCLHYLQYTYLLEPLLIKVEPSRAARYGALPLRVHLEDPLPKLAPEQEAGLKPLLMLEGAGGNGSDIVVPARLAANRRSLVGVLPAEQGPVRGGVHILRLSLDGQQFQRRGKPSVAVTIEGPTVSVANNSAFVFLPPGTSTPTTVELELVGAASRLPVTALLEVSQRSLSPMGYTEPDGPQEFVLGAEQVRWEAGESGPRNVTLFWEGLGGVPAAANLSMGALVLTIANVTNADINPLKDSAVVSGMPEDALAYAFTLVPNQVVYQGDPLRIPINVSNAHLRTPTVLLYNISATAGPFPSYLPRASLQGELRWDPVEDDEVAEIQLPINWTAVPPEAEYRLTLSVRPAWNALLEGPSNITAAHIFGVRPGQCPPGTYRTEARVTPGLAPGPGPLSSTGRDDARLSAILIKGANGSSFDISSSFNPDVAEYGTAVPPDTSSATLCLRPMQGDSLVEVYGPDGTPLTSMLPPSAAPAPRVDQQAVFGIRNLLGISSSATSPSSSGNPSAFSSGGSPARLPAVGSPTSALHGSARGTAYPWRARGPPVADAPAAARARRSSGVSAMVSDRSPDAGAMCEKHTYQLPLDYGQNSFIIRITTTSGLDHWSRTRAYSERVVEGLAAIHPASAPRALEAGSRTNSSPGQVSAMSFAASSLPLAPSPLAASPSSSRSDAYTLSIVRLANPEHAVLAELNVTDSSHASYAVCSDDPDAERPPTDDWSEEGEGVPECEPNTSMWLNVSSSVEWVLLQPWLRWPHLEGVRVEVAGQVLSKGGDVGADQLEDTGAEPKMRKNTDFLPVALILGLVPGVPLEVPIVIIAEDGVTSLRYYLNILRDNRPEWANSTALGFGEEGDPIDSVGAAGLVLAAEAAGSTAQDPLGLGLPHTIMTQRRSSPVVPRLDTSSVLPYGWPVPPSQQAWCSTCPAGWASTQVDADSCQMCGPGSFAPLPSSPACLACPNGTYASSWGSTHCNHCIIGTYAPHPGSRLCLMCPDNMTNLEDGSEGCGAPIQPGTNLTMRFAVIVSFGVYLNGASLDEIATKVGVNASSEEILGHLIRTDTADAFNISVGDVEVTGISQIGRRMLYVNVSATLGVDVPPGASVEDVDTALQVANLSADEPIQLLSQNPDRFFGRTTKALDVKAEPDGAAPVRTESRPMGWRPHRLALAWPAILALCVAGLLLLGTCAFFYRYRHRRLLEGLLVRLLPASMASRYCHTQLREDSGQELPSISLPSSAGLISRSRTPHAGGSRAQTGPP